MGQSVLLFICLIFASLWVIQAFECDNSLPAQAGVLICAVPSPPPVLCLFSSWKDKMCNFKKPQKLKNLLQWCSKLEQIVEVLKVAFVSSIFL